MSTYSTLRDLLQTYVTFYNRSRDSWERCYCELCGDGSRTKGPRGGWLFEGDMAAYRCFNCGAKATFDPNREYPFSREMRDILKAFGVPEVEYNYIAYKGKLDRKDRDTGVDESDEPAKKFIPLKFFDVPRHFYSLAEADSSNVIATLARQKLWDKWRLKDTDYPFMLSTGETNSFDANDRATAKALFNRIIVPFYKNGKMMYYQARAIDDDNPKRYINMDVQKTNVIFNMDVLYRDMDRPLYIFEGAMDAIHVNGVAVMEDNLSEQQIDILNKSPRRKVVVPDQNQQRTRGKGNLVELGVYQEGWGLALPQLGSGTKDLSEGIKRYGKLHVIKSLIDNTFFDDEARLNVAFV